MSEKFTHACIKCSSSYEDTDPEPYYCTPCNDQRKEIAKQVDAKIPKARKQPMSALQEYDAAPKVRGFMRTTLN